MATTACIFPTRGSVRGEEMQDSTEHTPDEAAIISWPLLRPADGQRL